METFVAQRFDVGKLGTAGSQWGLWRQSITSDTRHMPPAIDELAPEERIERYREMAEHTRAIGQKVHNPKLREAYMELSGRWRALAESTQRSFAPKDPR
jgi:hypothetical protein